jgi:small neutral amino acid transporter SnatA (MarC family)
MTRSQRLQVALRGTVTGAGILAVFAIAGAGILGILGISLGAFRIAGGILLFWIAFRDDFRKTPRTPGKKRRAWRSPRTTFPMSRCFRSPSR